MKILIFFSFIILSISCFGQNIKLEISDYSKRIEGKEYATYQFVNSSYSYSRATIVFITNKKSLFELSTKFPSYYSTKKQEYTDVWILGISDFDSDNISEIDKKIINNFFQFIIKYRNDNGLPPYSEERLNESKIFLKGEREICRYFNCSNNSFSPEIQSPDEFEYSSISLLSSSTRISICFLYSLTLSAL